MIHVLCGAVGLCDRERDERSKKRIPYAQGRVVWVCMIVLMRM